MKKIAVLLFAFTCQFCLAQEFLWPIKRVNTFEGQLSIKNKELDIKALRSEYEKLEFSYLQMLYKA